MTKLRTLFAALIFLLFSAYTGAQSVAEKKEFRVGATVTLTGLGALWGKHESQGLRLAEEEINQAGGVGGRSLKLFLEDYGQLDLKRAISAAQHLVSEKKVDVFLPMFIEDAEVVVPILTPKSIFSMAISCGGFRCGRSIGPYNVRITASDTELADALLKEAARRKFERACVVASEGTWSSPFGDYLKENWQHYGRGGVTLDTIPWGMTEMQSLALRLKKQRCDLIFGWLSWDSAGPFVRALRTVGMQTPVFGPYWDEQSIVDSAGKAMFNVVAARQKVATEEFSKKYEKRWGEPPMKPAAHAYDALYLIAKFAPLVGTDGKKLSDAIVAVKDYQGASGAISFSEDGERRSEEVELFEFTKDGKRKL